MSSNRAQPNQQKYKRWTAEDERELCCLYGTIPATKLAERFGVSPAKLRDKASHMQLTTNAVKARNRAAAAAGAAASAAGDEEDEEAISYDKQRTAHGFQKVVCKPGYRIITHTLR